MPAYIYECNHCRAKEQRISGINNHIVKCEHCGNSMLRRERPEELLRSYGRKFVASR